MATNFFRTALISTLLVAASSASLAAVECTDRWGHRYTMANPIDGMACTALVEEAASADEVQALASSDAAQIFNFANGAAPAQAIAAGRGGLVLASASAAPRISTGAGAPSTREFDDIIEATAREYGHDADLLRAIIHVESRGNANAVSSKGAIGLMQVMPATAAGLGLDQPGRALFQPEANVRTGAAYLTRLFKMFPGRIDLVIAAYNAGEGNVRKYKDSIPPFPETQNYVRDVMARYDNLRSR